MSASAGCLCGKVRFTVPQNLMKLASAIAPFANDGPAGQGSRHTPVAHLKSTAKNSSNGIAVPNGPSAVSVPNVAATCSIDWTGTSHNILFLPVRSMISRSSNWHAKYLLKKNLITTPLQATFPP